MASTYPTTTDVNRARHPRPDGRRPGPIPLTDEMQAPSEIGTTSQTSHWWLRRVEHDAEVLDAFLIELAKANRGPLALGGITREFRRFVDRQEGTERMSRDRLHGALVLLALKGRVHIYGDPSDLSTKTTFQAEPGTVGARQTEQRS
jgi:hypothetical protein